MKRLILLLSLCAWTACAQQQSLTVTFSFTADQWEALTNKLAVVNATLATKYTNDLAAWVDESVKAKTLKQPDPPKPVQVSLTVEQYIQRFAAESLGNTKQELRASREGVITTRIRDLTSKQLEALSNFLRTNNVVP